MYSQFKASYERVEASLQKLTDSIAAYNPSTAASEELEAADEAVQENVDILIQHQQNHQRIEDLRRTADSLDEQIKNTIRLLADTRKEIQAIPSSGSEEPRREVKVDELLSYAKYISKTTVPPTLRKPIALPKTDKDAQPDAQITNGIATPPQGTSQQEEAHNESRGVKELGDQEKAWLIPENLQFDPWPSFHQITKGALGNIQYMVEQGRDPASVLSAEEQAEVDRKRKEEEEREKAEEEERQKRLQAEWGFGRRGTVVEEPFNPDDL